MQLSETLMLAGIHEVERRGWSRRLLERPDGSVCAVGGLNAAAYGTPQPGWYAALDGGGWHTDIYAISDATYKLLGEWLPSINDNYHTPTPVFNVMRRLAARLSPYGQQADTTEDTATLNEWAA